MGQLVSEIGTLCYVTAMLHMLDFVDKGILGRYNLPVLYLRAQPPRPTTQWYNEQRTLIDG